MFQNGLEDKLEEVWSEIVWLDLHKLKWKSTTPPLFSPRLLSLHLTEKFLEDFLWTGDTCGGAGRSGLEAAIGNTCCERGQTRLDNLKLFKTIIWALINIGNILNKFATKISV